MPRAYLVCVGIVLLSAVAWGFVIEGAEHEGIVKISADDLASGKVVVIGRLGAPLKTMITVRGTWQHPPRAAQPVKDFGLRFHVTHVNGSALTEPVDFH